MLLLSRLSCIRKISSATWNIVRITKIHTIPTRRPQLATSTFGPTVNAVSKRTFFKQFGWNPTQRQLKEIDNVPNEFTLIYRSTMNKYIKITEVVITLATGILLFAYCMNRNNVLDMKYEVWSAKTKPVENEELVYLSTFLFIVVLIQVLIVQIPLRIYKVPKRPQYIMIVNSHVPLTTKHLKVERGNIFYLGERRGFLPWKDNKYVITTENDEKQIILLEQYFRRPADLSIMLGEQKDPETE